MSDFLPTTPEQRDFNNPLLDLRPRKVRAWIDELPLHDPGEALPQLLDVIIPLNQEPLPDKDRVRLLEAYLTPVTTLIDTWESLQHQFGNLPAEQREALEAQFAELLWQLASGYKIVVRNGHGAGRTPARDGLLLLASYRVLELQGTILLDAYRRYAAVPPQLFRELGQCFHFVQQHGAHERNAQIDRKHSTPHTPELLFKHAMLLAAADPFRLPAGHAVRLFQQLARLAHLCQLTPPPWEDSAARFVIDPRDDRPPLPCAKVNADELPTGVWVLDVNPLRAAVQQQINDANDPARALGELEVLRRLLPDLRTPPKRRAERRKSDKELRVATGLAAAHYFLSEDGEEQVNGSAQTSAYGIEVYETDPASQTPYLLEPWKVLNESPKGYLLTRRHALDENLRVGEALGLFPPKATDTAPPEIGVVRWIKRGEEHWVQIGVEIVPGRPAAVDCTPLEPDAAPFEEPRALYLQRIPNRPIPPTLLGRRSLYRKECAIILSIGRQRGNARIGSLVLETDCLARITLKPVK